MDITLTNITPQDISPKDILEEFTIKPVTVTLPMNVSQEEEKISITNKNNEN